MNTAKMTAGLFLGLALFAGPGLKGEYVVRENLSYSNSSDPYAKERCVLDISYDDSAEGRPVIVWFHGGGMTGGSKYIPDDLTGCGYVVVAPNYRLLPNVKAEDSLDDAAAAVAWTFEHAEEFGGDPKKIFVSGHSAGGYLTSLIGLDKKWLGKYGVDADSIAGLIPYSGQAVTHYAVRHMNGIPELQATIDSLAPIFHVRKDAPPYIIISGDREQELYGRYEENAYLWRMLNLVGHPYVKIYELDGYNHGDMVEGGHHIMKTEIANLLKAKQL